jgi:hypothetical protein
MCEKGVKFSWTDECDTAFRALKIALTSSPILTYPIPGKTFILDTDASQTAIGAVLSQEFDEKGFLQIRAQTVCNTRPNRQNF